MKNLIVAILIVVFFIASVIGYYTVRADASTGDRSASFVFPEFSTGSHLKPIRPCQFGEVAYQRHPMFNYSATSGKYNTYGRMVYLMVCTSTAGNGKRWWRQSSYISMSASARQ